LSYSRVARVDPAERGQAARGAGDPQSTVGVLLVAAAHDLGNALGRLVVGAGVLRDEVLANPSAPPTDLLLQGLAQIESTGLGMQAQLVRLLDLARTEQMGRSLRLSPSPTDLVEIVRHVTAAFQMTTTRHRLRIEHGAARVVGCWDSLLLERVVGNLVGNAIKFSPGGGEILLYLENEIDAVGTWAVVHVQDQGIGVPSTDLGRIFEPFGRGSNAGQIAGAGVGLASAWIIAVEHGGTISAVSEEGVGSTFTLRLPLGTGHNCP
jgi:signal transduction histidine kinase